MITTDAVARHTDSTDPRLPRASVTGDHAAPLPGATHPCIQPHASTHVCGKRASDLGDGEVGGDARSAHVLRGGPERRLADARAQPVPRLAVGVHGAGLCDDHRDREVCVVRIYEADGHACTHASSASPGICSVRSARAERVIAKPRSEPARCCRDCARWRNAATRITKDRQEQQAVSRQD